MIASIPFFTHRGSTKFSAPDDESRIEQTTLLEVFQQAGNTFIHTLAECRMTFFNAGV